MIGAASRRAKRLGLALALPLLLIPTWAHAEVEASADTEPSAHRTSGAAAPRPLAPKKPTAPSSGHIAPPVALAVHAAPAPALASPSAHAAPAPLLGAELEAVVRSALESATTKLPRGAALTRVRALAPVVVPAGTTRTTIDVTPPPRRAGVSSTTAVLVFWRGDTLAARSPVTLEITASRDAAPEVPKGTPVLLVVKREGFEVTTPALTATDGDVGETISVLLRPSGRSLRAQLATRERAIAVEGPR
jgi:hypothetical protein